MDKAFARDLVGLNCAYNYKEESDGKCRSETCVMQNDPRVVTRIQNEGCEIFKKMPEAIKEIKLKEDLNGN